MENDTVVEALIICLKSLTAIQPGQIILGEWYGQPEQREKTGLCFQRNLLRFIQKDCIIQGRG